MRKQSKESKRGSVSSVVAIGNLLTIAAAVGCFGLLSEPKVTTPQAVTVLEMPHLSASDSDRRCSLFEPALQRLAPIAKEAGPTLPTVPQIPWYKLKPYVRHIATAARAYKLDAALLKAVIAVESGYDPYATSERGASGLMQLMPTTAEQYEVYNLFDPAENIKAGALHLRYLLRLFDNDTALALAAYNAGAGSVLKHGRRIPPFGETATYVPKVMAYYRQFQQKI